MSRSDQDSARPSASAQLSTRTLLRFWFPLAASWLLMSTETPLVTAVIARMPDAKLQLAAFGVAFSLALMVESPVIALLTAGNALVRDRSSLRLVRRFMLGLSAALTGAMLLLAGTPLFDLVVLRLIRAPAKVAALVRPVLWVMNSWPAAIAYRRFHQGIMIRRGYTRQMSYGTVIRLCTTLAVSVGGLFWSRLNGATVAGLALGCAVIAEALYVHYASRPALRQVEGADPLTEGASLALSGLLRFYAPLALTSMIFLSTTPLLNMGIVRSPWPLESLAVWPVVYGQLFIVRSFGYSLQEAVVALLNGPAAMRTLRRFAMALGVGSLLLLVAIAFTPLGLWWQMRIAGLSPELTAFALPALRWAILLPTLAALQSWLRGLLVAGKTTGAIAWATGINLSTLVMVLLVGASLGRLPGASLAAIALTLSQGAESVWLWVAVRSVRLRGALLLVLRPGAQPD